MVALALALVFGSRLHDWARQRIVQMSVLAEVTEQVIPQPVAADPQGVPAPVEEAPGAAQEVADAGPDAIAPVVEPVNILLLGTCLLYTSPSPRD